METIQKTKVNRSLALKKDNHLKSFFSQIDVVNGIIKINNYAYIDHEVVGGGAMFFFVPFDKCINETWDNKDIIELFVEFPDQRYYIDEDVQGLGRVKTGWFKLISQKSPYFDMDMALEEAEVKAFDYITSKYIRHEITCIQNCVAVKK